MRLHLISIIEFFEKFNNQTSTQGSAILKIKYFNPPALIFQHSPVEHKVKKHDIIRMQKSYIIDILTSVGIQEIVKTGGKVVHIYELVSYRENFKITPSKKVIEKLINLRSNIKVNAMISSKDSLNS